MNIVDIMTDSVNMYPGDAGQRTLGSNHFEAYMVLSRWGTSVAVVTGSGSEERVAIEMLVRKLKMLRESFDLMCHEAFWQHMEREAEERMKQLREQLGMPQLEKAKKVDDGGLS